MNPSAAAHQAVSPNEIYIDQTLYTGRPDNFTLRLPKEQRVYTCLLYTSYHFRLSSTQTSQCGESFFLYYIAKEFIIKVRWVNLICPFTPLTPF